MTDPIWISDEVQLWVGDPARVLPKAKLDRQNTIVLAKAPANGRMTDQQYRDWLWEQTWALKMSARFFAIVLPLSPAREQQWREAMSIQFDSVRSIVALEDEDLFMHGGITVNTRTVLTNVNPKKHVKGAVSNVWRPTQQDPLEKMMVEWLVAREWTVLDPWTQTDILAEARKRGHKCVGICDQLLKREHLENELAQVPIVEFFE